jgi:hypothetical protein
LSKQQVQEYDRILWNIICNDCIKNIVTMRTDSGYSEAVALVVKRVIIIVTKLQGILLIRHNNILYLTTGCNMQWHQRTQNSNQWWNFVYTIMNIQIPWKVRSFSTSWGKFSKRGNFRGYQILLICLII